MIGLDELVRRFAGFGKEVDRGELVRWVENRWILPEQQVEREGETTGETRGESWLFHEVDVARVELILEIRHEFVVDDEAMPLVLGLLDQVYSLRRQMGRLCDALESQPPEVQEAIRRALPKAGEGG